MCICIYVYVCIYVYIHICAYVKRESAYYVTAIKMDSQTQGKGSRECHSYHKLVRQVTENQQTKNQEASQVVSCKYLA